MSAFELAEEERAEVDAMVADLHSCGYQDIPEYHNLRPGVRIRHSGHRWPEAHTNGTGVVVAITHRADSSWSREWGKDDVELIARWDKPSFGSRFSQLAQYHVWVVAIDWEESR